MPNLKTAFTLIGLAVAAASAFTWPAYITFPVQQVSMIPNYTGTTSPYPEGNPAFYVKLNNVLYVSNYNSDKTKAMYQLAVSAMTSGKKLALYYDVDKTLTITSCSNYESNGCNSINTPASYPIIKELALVP